MLTNDIKEKIALLRRVPIFGKLATEDLLSLAEIATERTFQRDERLCQEGGETSDLILILEGRAQVVRESESTSQVLRALSAGDHIGELSILGGGFCTATVIAEGGSVRALVIPAKVFRALLRYRPEVSEALLASLANRMSK